MAKRTDINQPQIVLELRRHGVTVQQLHTIGKGCPDILCGYQNKNYLFEIKDPDKIPSQQRLNGEQKIWHASWNGQVDVIKTAEEALVIMVND